MAVIHEVIICPNCEKEINPSEATHVVKRGQSRFNWWVTPVNLFLISIMFLLLELGTNSGSFTSFKWSPWVVAGIWIIYFGALFLTLRIEDSWFYASLIFVGFCVYLALLDLEFPSKQPTVLGLTWSFYPIVIILFLLVLLPVNSYFGQKRKQSVELLKEVIKLEEEHVKGA